MTPDKTPTDAELEALLVESAPILGAIGDRVRASMVSAMRVAFAKWGTPAGAGEPDNAFPLASKIYKRGDEWVLEVSGTINDCNFTCRHTQPGGLQPEDVAGLPTLYTTPQPTQAQAGADAVVEEVANGLRRYGLTLVKTASGYDVLSLREVAAHSIKGADHG